MVIPFFVEAKLILISGSDYPSLVAVEPIVEVHFIPLTKYQHSLTSFFKHDHY